MIDGATGDPGSCSQLGGALRSNAARLLTLRTELTALMDSAGIDAWLAPAATGVAPRGLESTGDPVMNLPWTHSGLPVVGMPAGRNPAGLPLGVQLIGRWMADENVLAWAERMEPFISRPADEAAALSALHTRNFM